MPTATRVFTAWGIRAHYAHPTLRGLTYCEKVVAEARELSPQRQAQAAVCSACERREEATDK